MDPWTLPCGLLAAERCGDRALVRGPHFTHRHAERALDLQRVAADLTYDDRALERLDRGARPGHDHATRTLSEQACVVIFEDHARPDAALDAALGERARQPTLGHVVRRWQLAAAHRG